MGWLVGPALAAAVLSGFLLYIYDHFIAAGAHGILSGLARACLAIGAGTAVIAISLLRSFDERTRWIRGKHKEVKSPAKSFIGRFLKP